MSLRGRLKANLSKNSSHPSNTLKPAFDAYVTKHNLVGRDFKTITIDEPLAAALGKSMSPGDKVNRDEILRRLRNGGGWSVSVGGVVK